ncbi:MAG TPA: biopolymer transporter ExbD, partial [Spirochaetota bacterium]|nr:biopolymer transporter ExbD [Spirochaetota bacterium]
LAFSLLVFFMISYNASQGRVSSIVVNLPRAIQTGEYREGNTIISINNKNEVFINDAKFNLSALPREIESRKEKMKKGTVIIRGDRKSNYETIVKIMDYLNRSGIPKFTLATIKSNR